MKKVLCFGEILLRFSPQLQGKWIKDASLAVFVGGAELNVASALANWEIPVDFCSALPHNYMALEVMEQIEARRIDTKKIHFSGNRIGTYYLPEGADLKDKGVIYDRANSSFSEIKPGSIDWDSVLEGIEWFHFSAINPALSENIALVCLEAVKTASQKGIPISIDLNYRSKLWQYGKHPTEIMPELVQYCDVIMGNVWSANSLLGIPLKTDLLEKESSETYIEQAKISSKLIAELFPKSSTIANTFRMENENGMDYYATIQDSSGFFSSKKFHRTAVPNKVGSGDCFMAGLIFGILNNLHPQEIVDFSAAAAIGKMQEQGDSTLQTITEIQKTRHHDQ